MNLGFFEYFQVLRILFRDPFIFLRVEASDFFYGNFRRKKLEASRCFMEDSFVLFSMFFLTIKYVLYNINVDFFRIFEFLVLFRSFFVIIVIL